jgi:flagellar motility protein MotE (MotC chaperone)
VTLLIPSPNPTGTAFSPAQATAQETQEVEDKNQQPVSESEPADDRPASAMIQELRRREQLLDRREQDLKALEQRVDRKLAELREMESSVQKMLEEAQSVKDARIKHLIGVYSNMKPKEAAKVLETLDQDIAVKILSGMQGRTAGEILSFVDTERAAVLTETLTNLQVPFKE